MDGIPTGSRDDICIIACLGSTTAGHGSLLLFSCDRDARMGCIAHACSQRHSRRALSLSSFHGGRRRLCSSETTTTCRGTRMRVRDKKSVQTDGSWYGDDGFCVVTRDCLCLSALNGKSGRVTFSSGEKNLCWAAKRKRKISPILSESRPGLIGPP